MQSRLFLYPKEVLTLVKFKKERGNAKIIRHMKIFEKGWNIIIPDKAQKYEQLSVDNIDTLLGNTSLKSSVRR